MSGVLVKEEEFLSLIPTCWAQDPGDPTMIRTLVGNIFANVAIPVSKLVGEVNRFVANRENAAFLLRSCDGGYDAKSLAELSPNYEVKTADTILVFIRGRS